MISDILSEAVTEIDRYMDKFVGLRNRMEALRVQVRHSAAE